MRFLPLLLLVSCAHFTTPVPSALPFFAVQCVEIRQISCLVDADLSAERCHSLVDPAAREINVAVGRDVFAIGPDLDLEQGKAAFAAGILVVAGGALPAGILGSTMPKVEIHKELGAACIDKVGIVLSAAWLASGEVDMASVTLHEMLHALGAGHSLDESNYDSTMRAIHEEKVRHLTRADVVSLRAVYGY